MTRILFVSHGGDSAGLAFRCQQEGDDVLLFIHKPNSKNTLKGVVPQANSVSEGLNFRPDAVIYDMVGHGAEADQIRRMRYAVFGASAFADKIELDRNFGAQVLKAAGVEVPDTKTFKTVTEARRFADANPSRYVVKPSGNADTALTYLPTSPVDLDGYLGWLERRSKDFKLKEILLQRMLDGVEVSTELWFVNGVPIGPATGTLETKRSLVGEVGPMTGAQTSVVWSWNETFPLVAIPTLKRLVPELRKQQYSGPLDINAIVTDDGRVQVLEFTARFGYNAIYAMAELLERPIGEVLVEVAGGRMFRLPLNATRKAYALRVSIPPYPYNPSDDAQHQKVYNVTRGLPIQGLIDWEHAWPLDVMQEPDVDSLTTAGVDGVVMELTASGNTIEDARDQTLRAFDRLELPNKQARLVDGADRAINRLPQLLAAKTVMAV